MREALLRQELEFVRSAVRSERARSARLEEEVERHKQDIRDLRANLTTLRLWLWGLAGLSLLLGIAAVALLRRPSVLPRRSSSGAPGPEKPLQERLRAAEARLRAIEQEAGMGAGP